MRRIAPTLVLALALLAPRGAAALDIEKRFGIGYQMTLAGAQGLSGRYQASQAIGLELIAGVQNIWADDDAIGSFDTMFFAGGFSFVLASDDRGLVSLGTRVNVGTSTFDKRASTERVTDIAFEVPLTIEYFVTPHFSLRAGVGLVFAILKEIPEAEGDEADPEDNHVLLRNDTIDRRDPAGGSAVSIGTGELLGNGGFTIWF